MKLSKPKKQKEYKAEYLKDFKPVEFIPKKVPGINDDLIKRDISTIA